MGKTTTATTLSYLLSKEGCKVALIDFDGQRHTTKLCGVTIPEQLSVTIYDILKCIVMNEELPDKESYMIRTETGVDLIPANNKLDNFDKLMCDTDFAEYKLKEFVDTIKDQYDYILIDGMPKMGTAMINVMICADSLIIPVQSETLAVEGMAEFLRAFHRIKSHANARLEIEGILITMDNERTRVSKRVKAQLQHALGEKVRIFTNSIPRSIKVPEAVEYILLLVCGTKPYEIAHTMKLLEQYETKTAFVLCPFVESALQDTYVEAFQTDYHKIFFLEYQPDCMNGSPNAKIFKTIVGRYIAGE